MILFDKCVIVSYGNTFWQVCKHIISSWRSGLDLAIGWAIRGNVKQPIMWKISRMDSKLSVDMYVPEKYEKFASFFRLFFCDRKSNRLAFLKSLLGSLLDNR